MSDKTGKKVTLEINDKEYDFTVDLPKYNACVDGTAKGQVSAASYNFVSMTVKEEQREEILELLDEGLAVDIAQLLVGEFKPTVKITVKKSKAA